MSVQKVMPILIGKVLGSVLSTLRGNVWALAGTWAVSTVLPGAFVFAACSVFGLNSDAINPGIQTGDSRILLALVLIGLVWIVSRTFGFTLVAVMTANSTGTEAPPFKSMLSQAVVRLGSVLGAVLLVWLVYMAGILFFVLPGLYLGVRLSVAASSACIEGLSPIAAMRRSWTLTKGRFWNAAGLVFSAYGIAVPLLWVNIKFNALIAATLGAHGSAGGAAAGLLMNTFQFVLTAWVSACLMKYLLELSNLRPETIGPHA